MNGHTTTAARVEETAQRILDAATARHQGDDKLAEFMDTVRHELRQAIEPRDELLRAMREVLTTREAEAKAAMSYQRAVENFSDRGRREAEVHTRAMVAATEAEKKARALIAKTAA